MIKKTFILFFFLLSCGSAFTQIQLSGLVQDSINGNALMDVEVFIQETSEIVNTDEKGYFKFSLPQGRYTLIFLNFEYNFKEELIDLRENTELIVNLSKLSINLSVIEIANKRKELFALKTLKDFQGTSIYAGKKNEVVLLDLTNANLSTNNAREIYAQVAGLNIFEGNDGGLQLGIGGRGLDPNRTANFNTRQNGYDISADVLGYPENYYTPPSEALEEIQILRGASSLQYGTQFGGLINFKIRKEPLYKEFSLRSNQTYGSFNFFNSFNQIGINKDKLSLNAFYNYKKGDGYRANSNFESNNLFLALDYRFSSKLKSTFDLTYFNYLAKQAGGLTDQQFAENPRLSTRTRNWFNVDWLLYSLKTELKLSEKTTASINLFGLNAERNSLGFRGNPQNLNENPITALDEQNNNGDFILPRDLILGDFNNYGAELRLITEFNIGDKRLVSLVGSKFYNASNASVQGPGTTGTDANFHLALDQFPDYANQSTFDFPNRNIALFTEQILYLNPRFSIVPGLRYEWIKTESIGEYNQVIFDNAGNPINNQIFEDNRDLNRQFLLAGIGIAYKQSESFNLYANISQNYRSVTFSDIRVVNPSFIIDPNISDEKGFTFDLGIRGRLKKLVSYDISAFSLYYNDRIGIILDNRANRVRKNIGTALIYGIESLFQFNIDRILEWDTDKYALNFFINTALTSSEYIDSEENNVEGKKVEFIPNINLKSGVAFGYKNFRTSIQYTYLSEQFTDVQNSRIAQNGDIRSGIIGEIPSYMILDWSMSYTIDAFNIKTGINNALNEAYFTRRATGYPGPGIIPSDGRAFYITLSYQI